MAGRDMRNPPNRIAVGPRRRKAYLTEESAALICFSTVFMSPSSLPRPAEPLRSCKRSLRGGLSSPPPTRLLYITMPEARGVICFMAAWMVLKAFFITP